MIGSSAPPHEVQAAFGSFSIGVKSPIAEMKLLPPGVLAEPCRAAEQGIDLSRPVLS